MNVADVKRSFISTPVSEILCMAARAAASLATLPSVGHFNIEDVGLQVRLGGGRSLALGRQGMLAGQHLCNDDHHPVFSLLVICGCAGWQFLEDDRGH